jgi:GT2 family glycosyltransferase
MMEGRRQPLVITVILNTNRKDDTLACLASLHDSAYLRNHIIVLDNASTDGSVESIRERFPEVDIIELDENKGYAGNNNVGIRAALEKGADWVFVLNEDTLLAPDSIEKLVNAAEADPAVGIAGPMVYHHDEPDVIQSAGGSFGPYLESIHIAHNVPDRGQFKEPARVDWISGCAILVRRAVIEDVGILDERFFYYWEETEWCMRAGRSGWKILNVPQAHLWHKGVQRDYRPGPSVTYYNTRNRFLMLAKHNAPLKVWLHVWSQTLQRLISWTVKPRWRHLRQHRTALWLGVLDFLRQRWGPMPR